MKILITPNSKAQWVKPQEIADILGITYNEDLYPRAEFDTDAHQIVPHTVGWLYN